MVFEFEQLKDEIVNIIEREKSITLATSVNNKVTARTMSHVNEDLTIYFQTSGSSEKIKQIEQNPNIALAVANIQIEAIVRNCGHPLGSHNKTFIEKYKENFLYILKSTRTCQMKF
ncbi:MAG: pyridoxamine 5'-phosphate oxidase family protein [Clostridia bacterium]